MSIIKDFQHLRKRLEDIQAATNDFSSNNYLGKGAFGKVYKGELEQTSIAVKRLESAFGQGNPEFWKEVMMLSRYRHENLISLLGFCDERDEKILVYEYASHGSLDHHLSSTDLNWTQRLKICVGAAHGLEFLHNPRGTQQRLLHRDIKSSNILLDEKWVAKISDFGLSKIGPANQQFTYLVSNVAGTFGYCDPSYMESGFLTKASDVYSFGVVMFEVLCGRLCIDNHEDRRPLTVLVRQCYEQNKLQEIIFHDIKDQIKADSLKAFTTIAYRCLKRDREKRPTMAQILKQLEVALEFQERKSMNTQEEMNIAGPSMNFGEVVLSVRNIFSKPEMDITSPLSFQRANYLESNGLKNFSYASILGATNNFSNENNLRDNGFGLVYKGITGDGDVIAIKRLSKALTQGFLDFVNTMASIRHRNLVRVLGCCMHEKENLLIYEFVPNESLDLVLFDENRKALLDWRRRFEIIQGVAMGLQYLHEQLVVRVVHGDLKASNILLDFYMKPKISGFGLWRIYNQNIIGTFAYLSPESMEGIFSVESDVFSFGVLMLEIVSGRRNSSSTFYHLGTTLTQYAWELWRQGNALELKEPALGDTCDIPQSLRTVHVALLCVQEDETDRPTMSYVISMLENDSVLLPTPNQPASSQVKPSPMQLLMKKLVS